MVRKESAPSVKGSILELTPDATPLETIEAASEVVHNPRAAAVPKTSGPFRTLTRGGGITKEFLAVSEMRLMDLAAVQAVRHRIVGLAHYTPAGRDREQYGDTTYVLVLEPENKADKNAIAVYGHNCGRKVGFLSAAKAAQLHPILKRAEVDGFTVAGESTRGISEQLWVDVPNARGMAAFLS